MSTILDRNMEQYLKSGYKVGGFSSGWSSYRKGSNSQYTVAKIEKRFGKRTDIVIVEGACRRYKTEGHQLAVLYKKDGTGKREKYIHGWSH